MQRPYGPRSGIALAALLIYGRSVWPGIYIGGFIANLTNGGAVTPPTIVFAAAIASGNTLEALAGRWLTQRFAGGLSAFDRASAVFWFAALAAGGSTLISASVGVFTLIMAGLAPTHDAAAIADHCRFVHAVHVPGTRSP